MPSEGSIDLRNCGSVQYGGEEKTRNKVAKRRDKEKSVRVFCLSRPVPQKRSGINAEEWRRLETAAQSWGFDKESRRISRTSSSNRAGVY